MTRPNTNKLLEMVEEGYLDKDQVILACVSYMTDDEVAEMCKMNEFFDTDEDEEEEK